MSMRIQKAYRCILIGIRSNLLTLYLAYVASSLCKALSGCTKESSPCYLYSFVFIPRKNNCLLEYFISYHSNALHHGFSRENL